MSSYDITMMKWPNKVLSTAELVGNCASRDREDRILDQPSALDIRTDRRNDFPPVLSCAKLFTTSTSQLLICSPRFSHDLFQVGPTKWQIRLEGSSSPEWPRISDWLCWLNPRIGALQNKYLFKVGVPPWEAVRVKRSPEAASPSLHINVRFRNHRCCRGRFTNR